MRVSTSYSYQLATNGILDRQAELAKLQQQVATGKRMLSAADDPAGAAMSLNLQQNIDNLSQYKRNADTVQSRLGLEDNVLSNTSTLLVRIRELALEGVNATQTDATRGDIATELDQLSQQLLSLGNSRDSSGHYLFSGYQTGSAPFAAAGGGVSYVGDSGTRQIRIGPSRAVSDGDPGNAVFMGARSGNGTFSVAAGPNSGAAVLKSAGVTNAASWVPDTYTLSFAGAGGWTVTNSGGATVASGTYSSGQAIAFNGIQVTLDGTPSAGDSFTLSPSSSRSAFDVVDSLRQAFSTPAPSAADKAALANRVFSALQDLTGIGEHLSSVRSSVGARLNAIDQQTAANDAANVQLKASLSGLQDLDYARAVSDMQLKLTGLQAAQQAFLKIQGLSLFNYLR